VPDKERKLYARIASCQHPKSQIFQNNFAGAEKTGKPLEPAEFMRLRDKDYNPRLRLLQDYFQAGLLPGSRPSPRY
jgi:hypothetical protein